MNVVGAHTHTHFHVSARDGDFDVFCVREVKSEIPIKYLTVKYTQDEKHHKEQSKREIMPFFYMHMGSMGIALFFGFINPKCTRAIIFFSYLHLAASATPSENCIIYVYDILRIRSVNKCGRR